LNWSRKKDICGGREMIETDCKLFCITKKDGIYQPMKLRGRQWIYLNQTRCVFDAKKIIEASR